MTATMRLYINVDHVATVRQARRTDEPDPVEAALLCEAAGADGITAHLREDRRHIQDHDLERLRPAVKVLNLELATSSEIVALTCRLRPYQATLVPERREEITTEGGLDLLRRASPAAGHHPAAGRGGHPDQPLRRSGPRPRWTPPRTSACPPSSCTPAGTRTPGAESDEALDELRRAARHAADMGLFVHAGHGLTYLNVQPVASIPEIEELNIGHSVVSRALMAGCERGAGHGALGEGRPGLIPYLR